MSGHDRQQRSIRISNKSPIATPARAALQGRPSRSEHHTEEQTSDSSPDAASGTSSPMKVEIGGRATPIDKDDRIAFLEKEMAVMEDAFARELDLLGGKITNESEITAYWQQKHSTLNQQFLKTDTDLRVLRHENTVKEKHREERDKDIKTRISSLLLDRDSLREEHFLAQAVLDRKEDEISRLRSQVKGLKDFVSTNSRTDGQVTDEVFGEMMQRVGNGLQNWVIQNFRKAKLDPSKAREGTREALLTLVPTYDTQVSSSKIHLIQSIVSRLLVASIFNSYFVGLEENRVAEMESLENYLITLKPGPGSANQWRSFTLAAFKKGVTAESTKSVIDTAMHTINNILDDISDVSRSEARDQPLRAIIKDAIDLSQLLRVQKAVFRTFMPVIEGHQVTLFDAETMEDMGGEDEDGLQGREIRCVTFPGIIKEGDESGEQTQLRNVIAKARVLCSPD